jgi:hypothetical protein
MCACGVAYPGPWELAAHFMKVYPPHADKSIDGKCHADRTRLDVKLAKGTPGAWEVVTWACDSRRDLRVAASIAHRAKTGDLRRYRDILRKDIRDTYQVSMYSADAALLILSDRDVVSKFGARYSLICGNVEATLTASSSSGIMLDLIARHVAALEGQLSILLDQLSAVNARIDASQATHVQPF